MNRLKKIISFVLCFSICLLFNVSYAELTNAPVSTMLRINKASGPSTVYSYGGYTYNEISTIVKNYGRELDNATYLETFNTMISAIKNAGYNIVCWKGVNSNYYCYAVFPKDVELGVGSYSMKSLTFDISSKNYSFEDFFYMNSYPEYVYVKSTQTLTDYDTLTFFFNSVSYELDIFYSNVSIKNMAYTNSSNTYSWDGTYLYETTETEEPGDDTPSLPSNADIAKAVQAFYNSDYYKNNKDFEDFIVLYNYDTQYFDFIGHNFGIDLGQVIVPPDYKYEGYSYNQDWWKFFLRNISSEIASNLWNRYYWLYSTNDFGENITNNGKGSIKDLINLHFPTKTVIVYSTTDYPVVKIETDENGVLNPVEGTVPGDQYTYNENLDPTTNEYNPLENFVPTNPSQTILGDVNFDEINKVFEENKDILNIEKASWLFSANNQLVSYFLGFLLLLIVFLIIARVLGG